MSVNPSPEVLSDRAGLSPTISRAKKSYVLFRRTGNLLSNTYFYGMVGLVLAFLYIPLVVLIAYSFNSSRSLSWPMTGFLLEWYERLFDNKDLLEALWNSVYVSTSATALTLVIGVPAALALDRLDFPGKGLFRKFVLLPIALPGIITCISMLILFRMIGFGLSLETVIIGHATALLAVVVTQVFARLQRLPKSLEEASTDLGASGLQTFFQVTLPNIRTAIIGAGLLAFTLSFDEIPVTFFFDRQG